MGGGAYFWEHVVYKPKIHYGTLLQYAVLCPCRLNLPGCLPDVYVPMKDPQPCGSKGFIGALFGGGPSEMNKEEICKSNLLSKLSLFDLPSMNRQPVHRD